MKIKLNENFGKIPENYLFSEIARRVDEQRHKNPSKKIISLGIGDVTLPLPECVSYAMSHAAMEMSIRDGFRGYGDTRGLLELRNAIAEYYKTREILLSLDEIFISDGAKSDLGNLCDLFAENEIVICDPVYPVYLDSNLMSGRKIRFLNATSENGFLPLPENLPKNPFIIYLCSPNNPTGAVYSREKLKTFVDFAIESGSLIIFDAAYESFISDNSLPHSIFEIEGARECAIEVCSFSKMAGFTGVRCGWTVIPNISVLNRLWARRQATKFNGVSYISQVGSIAALSPNGLKENAKNIAYYMENAHILADFLTKKGVFYCGGMHAPYLWLECPRNKSSWEFFDFLLSKACVVGTPGAGFGKNGEGFFRLSSFANRDDILEAVERLNGVL